MDRWGEGKESDDNSQRITILTTKINEENLVDLTKAPTFNDDEESSGEESDGWKESDKEDH